MAKNLLCRMLTLVLLVALMLTPVTLSRADTDFTGQYVLAVVRNPNPADRLHLRLFGSTNAPSLGKYYTGTMVQVVSGIASDEWVQVEIGTYPCYVTGYMQTKYLDFYPANNGVNSALPLLTVKNRKGTGLHLRAGASMSTTSMGLFLNGAQVQVLGITPGWYHVSIGGLTGYMSADGFNKQLPYDLSGSAAEPMKIGLHNLAKLPIA